MSWRPDPNFPLWTLFDVMAETDGFVSVGLSEDKKMVGISFPHFIAVLHLGSECEYFRGRGGGVVVVNKGIFNVLVDIFGR